MTLGELIRKARRDKELTIHQAALDMKMAPSHLHAIEKGKKPRPKMEIIYKLIVYYNLNNDQAFLSATRIPEDCFYKIIRCPKLLQVIRDYPE